MNTLVKSPLIIETGRGPTIAGTRITVFCNGFAEEW